jgi:predicted nucleic acid-binding protein
MGANHFVLVDAGFGDLMRPSMYGSHHGMSVLHADGSLAGRTRPTVVAGPLCESGDVFTQGEGGVVLPRDLPRRRWATCWCIHDTGAYGASMSSNYNTRPLIAEVLVDGGQARLIRRRQTVAELLALEASLSSSGNSPQMAVSDIRRLVAWLESTCAVEIITLASIHLAQDVRERYGFSWYDSLIIASALEADCGQLFSEDMQHGQVISDRLTIVNPFLQLL